MAFNAFNQDEKTVEKSKISTMFRLFKYLLKYKLRIFIVSVLMAFGTFVALINPLLIETAIDKYIAKNNFTGLVKITVIALVLNLLMILAIKLRMLLMAKTTNKIIENIREDLYVHIQSLDLHFFDSRPTGKILARITGDVNSLKDVIENSITTFIPGLVTVFAVTIIMFVKDSTLALATLSTIPLLIIGIVLISIKAEGHWRQKRKKSSNMSAFINESMQGIKIIQGFNAEKETEETFTQLVADDRKSFMNAVTWCDAFGSIIDLCWFGGMFMMYFVGIKIIGIENISIGTYIAFGSYIGMFWQPVMNLSNFYNQIVNAASGAERIFEILDTKPLIKDSDRAFDMPEIKGNVTFKNVTFGYDEEKTVLENVSFSVKAGQTVALVGPTGAGKSTIVNLISRFYDVQKGSILIDGINIQDVKITSLRKQMGIMTQDNYIFSGTIRENIAYGNLEASEEEILEAAKAVHAHDFIMELEHGYDTILTARGNELSNGQRQLIAFARTMLSMPRILILDEATSSIDTKTELQVQSGISAMLKDRTSFVIAHRLSTIQNADIIFVVDNKGIIESGSPKELMEIKGHYYNLYMAQFSETQ